jgi:hypothetical protein
MVRKGSSVRVRQRASRFPGVLWSRRESEHNLIKLDPDQVLTTQQAAELLEPYIKPLPPFDDRMLPRSR